MGHVGYCGSSELWVVGIMGPVGIVGRRNCGSSELWVVEIMDRRNYESSELWVVGIMGTPPPTGGVPVLAPDGHDLQCKLFVSVANFYTKA